MLLTKSFDIHCDLKFNYWMGFAQIKETHSFTLITVWNFQVILNFVEDEFASLWKCKLVRKKSNYH